MAVKWETRPDSGYSEDTSPHFGQKISQFDTPQRGTSLAELDFHEPQEGGDSATNSEYPIDTKDELEESARSDDEEESWPYWCNGSCNMMFKPSPKVKVVRSKAQHLSDARRARNEVSRLSGAQPSRSLAFRRQLAVVALRVEDSVHDVMIDLPQIPVEMAHAVFVGIPNEVFWIISDVVQAQGGLRSIGRRFFGR